MAKAPGPSTFFFVKGDVELCERWRTLHSASFVSVTSSVHPREHSKEEMRQQSQKGLLPRQPGSAFPWSCSQGYSGRRVRTPAANFQLLHPRVAVGQVAGSANQPPLLGDDRS